MARGSKIYLNGDGSTVPPCAILRPEIYQPKERFIAFGWYGGKFSHLKWLLPLLPKTHHFCDVFAGSASVLLNRPPSPVETYNDLDGDVVNFFRVLRDFPEELSRAIALTPFSREEFFYATTAAERQENAISRARFFYVKARQTRTGMAQASSLGRWANCKQTSRSGMAGSTSRWLTATPKLSAIADRLLRVQIENRPALDLLKTYDHKDTLFYCDPPYLHETRGDDKIYAHEMSKEDHRDFLEVVQTLAGKVAISGYNSKLYSAHLKQPKWTKIEAPTRTCHSSKTPRTEILWVNYKL